MQTIVSNQIDRYPKKDMLERMKKLVKDFKGMVRLLYTYP